MVKLPRRPIRTDSPPRQGLEDHTPRSDTLPSSGEGSRVNGVRPGGGDRGRSQLREADPQEMPLDLAIEAALAAQDVDAVTRVHLDEMRASLAQLDPRAALASLYGRNLAAGLLSFVMPRLRHPDVLLAEKHNALLEHLAGTFSAASEDSVVREGVFVIQQELRRLALLRQHRNSLIEG
ncbi:hypothetical protein QO058_30445 (plasmid) [Bosea vestrisii]|uniref:hypothetical protein n=1 Tax=Bosea vestrisii TaxID=151416 RepID=UPI0024DFA522|nr:hypothetical protein [Bosea vestrisii]WID99714.1 hypothetical protein QO058_30445 [Bosea vestrisii]